MGPVMVNVPGARFQMGSTSMSGNYEERPRHPVSVAGFAIGKFEVTVEEYLRFARATGRAVPKSLQGARASHPVTHVTWDDALAYTRWLSKETGAVYRLPSKAQWEYAARGGSASPYWWGFEFKTRMAHCFDCDTGLDPRIPTDVGRFPPNPFGLYDTAGNVSEWVYDCFHETYEGAPDDGAVFEGGQCEWRIARGGSFSNPSTSLRSAKRYKMKPEKKYDNVGFRVIRLR